MTSETQDTESQYSSNTRRQYRAKLQYPWQQDKSDLESIDSSIFRNSSHQLGVECPSSIHSSIRREQKHLVSRVEVHHHSSDNNLGVSRDLSKSRTNLDADIKLLEKISLSDTKYSKTSDYFIKEEEGSGITVIEIRNSSSDYPHLKASSVISYDSIYLSSESSEGKQTVFEDPNCAAHKATEDDLIAISIEVYDDLGQTPSEFERTDESTIDTLYSQVTKPLKPIEETEVEKIPVETFVRANSEIQYSSLPVAEIGPLLRKSERIDAKLRHSYQENKPFEEPTPDYDTIRKRPRQELPLISASGPSSIEESDKGAPSIELIQIPTKEVQAENQSELNTKVFIKELGLELDYANSVVNSDQDSDIVSIEPPPSVTLGGKKVIVDEVAAKAVKRTESGVCTRSNVKPQKRVENFKQEALIKVENIYDEVQNLNEFPVQSIQSNNHLEATHIDSPTEIEDKPITVIKVTTYKRRGPETRQQEPLHSKASALKIATFSSLIKEAANNKMPRPQLLQIVDSKRNTTKNCHQNGDHDNKSDAVKEEFIHKVDSVRNYWSKILEEVQNAEDLRSISEEGSRDDASSSRRTSFESSQNSSSYFTAKSNISNNCTDATDFQSFCPSVEIVELDGQKKAAIVKAKNFDEVDFDHVRYRVIKSDVFQKRILINSRKEAQFDGLLQYLQDYSFQELLANNNVVIIEPVRTKIEKSGEKKPLDHSVHCKITSGAGGHKKNAPKHQFYYHPVRVNKELLDEELPSPDTVRNVRQMFEHRFGMGSKQTVDDSKINTRNTDTLRKKALRYLSIDTSFHNGRKWDSASLSSGVSSGDLSSPCECNDETRRDDGQQIFASAEHLCQNDEGDDEFETHYVSQDILEKIRERGESTTYYGGRVLNKKDGKVSAMTKAIMTEINNHQNGVFTRGSKDEYLGMAFKLIKSNSCSSRLELAGTGKLPPDLENHSRHMLSPSPEVVAEEDEDEIHEEEEEGEHEDTQSISDPEPEETVRDIVSKLEHKSSQGQNNHKPKIIELHLKPKINGTNPVTINNQSLETNAISSQNSTNKTIVINSNTNELPEKKPVEPIKTSSIVSVNNHLTVTTMMKPSQRLQERIDKHEAARVNKVCRNKDVDLAFTNVQNVQNNKSHDNGNKKSNTPPMDRDELDTTPTHLKRDLINEKQYDSLDDNDSDTDSDSDTLVYKISNASSINISDNNGNNKSSDTIETSRKSSISSQNGNSNASTTTASSQVVSKTASAAAVEKIPTPTEIINNNNSKAKTVSWTTLGKFDGKLYNVNDKTLIEKKKYDEMEFEEFEIYDPSIHAKPDDDDNDENKETTTSVNES